MTFKKEFISPMVFLLLIASFQLLQAQLQNNPIKVKFKYKSNYFPLVMKGRAATLIIDSNDASVVKLAATTWCKDISLLTDTQPELSFKAAHLIKI